MIFGDKQIFAIEIQDLDSKKMKSKLRLWFKNESAGIMKVNFTLSYAIKTFEDLLTKGDEFYDEDFNGMNERQIFKYCFLLGKSLDDWNQSDYAKFEKYKRFSPYFGDQLDTVTKIIYIKEGYLTFIWSENTNYYKPTVDYMKNLKDATVSVEYFRKVVLDFLEYVRGQ
ncbi:MAG: hypothetical protein J0G98_18280 [Terrimonas ferruginea]|uniref:hypothetical protein n=1 Tax=Terrimonas ferruginea TaxID=249 RepID=UPI00086A159F|nr:hypothetical protein [Terrimonas ferruginea]MBN8785013.1 hypothetical protein [Terrimonas ferruginea]ODT49082.1 MAG: hypothetical protein ABS68_14200 [Niastella sp. SCN 39-18]OJW42019.1 MAG: hypothetical protein BGO56_05050 [Sphingobacteriales bacterium 48-107]